MAPSRECLDLVAHFEGYADRAYKCPAGIWTIGYGTTHYPGGKPVMEADTCTKEQAEEWLLWEIGKAASFIEKRVKVALNQHQFDALASFIYNVGPGAFEKSTLLKMLNAGDVQGAADQFGKWVNGGGKTLPGLVRRRAAERDLFLKTE